MMRPQLRTLAFPRSHRLGLSILLSVGLMSCVQRRDPSARIQDDALDKTHIPSLSSGETFVHLFEWTWADVAHECENFLAQSGYDAVQISPPNEHRDMTTAPWWQRYQPVSYRLESRSGSESEFIDMIQRCHAVGVQVYADAVINHMAGGVDGDRRPGVGWAQSRYSKYEYPGLFSAKDFNHCRGQTPGVIMNYLDRFEVQHCELVELSDLDTSHLSVQKTIAQYLNRLYELGIDGLRIDASKHIPAIDLTSILSKVPARKNIFLEVIEGPSEPIKAAEYAHLGRVTEFRYADAMTRAFRSHRLVDLFQIGQRPEYLPSERAVVFIDNHDSQRGHGAGGNPLSFKEPQSYKLANVFMLAWPYGQPVVMSSFNFNHGDDGPPSEPDGKTRPVHMQEGQLLCGRDWICEHRWPEIAAMSRFRKVVGESPKTALWNSNLDQIAFARKGKGFVAINGSANRGLKERLQTTLPPGRYCNVLQPTTPGKGDLCREKAITVDASGEALVDISPGYAVAFHIESRLEN